MKTKYCKLHVVLALLLILVGFQSIANNGVVSSLPIGNVQLLQACALSIAYLFKVAYAVTVADRQVTSRPTLLPHLNVDKVTGGTIVRADSVRLSGSTKTDIAVVPNQFVPLWRVPTFRRTEREIKTSHTPGLG